jgi:pimeloyl-ACP methyl ester carboxylesterase
VTAVPEEIQYPASGLRFGALAWGRADAPLALCLHGYPDTAWTWRHLGPALGEHGYRVVAPFQRGYAPSGLAPDGEYGIGALAHDAVEAHAALGGDGRAVLIGHDWGAAAAYVAASVAPERFRAVVTMAVPPPRALLRPLTQARRDLPVLVRQLPHSWYMAFQQIPRLSERSLDRLIPWLWRAWSPGYDGAADAARALAALDGPQRRTAALRYYRALRRLRARGPYAHEQRRVFAVPSQPLLYLHGRDDGCMLAALAERARPVLGPAGRLEIVEGAGHFLALERPEEVARLVLEFLEGSQP